VRVDSLNVPVAPTAGVRPEKAIRDASAAK